MREADMPIPHLFRCPISLDLFTDPVTLCTGQTYDRPSIERWFAAGKLTCPVTMQKLHDPSMVPNHTLRHLINQWIQMGSRFDPSFYDQTSIHRDPSVSALKLLLESPESTMEIKLQTLETIQVLCQDLPAKNSCLIQLGFFPLLLGLAFGKLGGQHSQEDYVNLKVAEQALVCAVKLLPYAGMGPLKMLQEDSKLDCFVVLFDHGAVAVKTSLCQLVEAISSSPDTGELCAALGNDRRLLRRMVLALSQGSGTAGAGIRAISALCCLERNRENLVREGAVEAAIECIMGHEERNLAATAMAVVELLLGVEIGKEAVMKHPSGINAIVKMVFRVSDHQGSENAVNSLMILCSDSGAAREGAICGGVLTQLLLLLQSQCSGRIKTKARMLLKLLRST